MYMFSSATIFKSSVPALTLSPSLTYTSLTVPLRSASGYLAFTACS